MPSTHYIVELPSIFLARGNRDDIHQHIRGDVGLTHSPPQALAVHVIFCQNDLHCMVEKIHTQCESSSEVDAY
jgi:hypothetical protein